MDKASTSLSTATPQTIVLAVWPWAPNHMVQRYIGDYHILFPHAEIQVLRPSLDSAGRSNLSDRKDGWQLGHVLLHVFGDKAADKVCRWLAAHEREQLAPLDVRWAVMDGEPALPTTLYRSLARRKSLSNSFDAICSTAVSWVKDQTVISSHLPWPLKTHIRGRELHRVDGLLPEGSGAILLTTRMSYSSGGSASRVWSTLR